MNVKLISWNVNGIRKALELGLTALLNERIADIYALQEVRCDIPCASAEIDGYHAYWSLCSGKRGYSGVMCLSRVKPIRVWRNLSHPDADPPSAMPGSAFSESIDDGGSCEGDPGVMPDHPFDLEGRAITLEFGDWFLVNVYAPSPHSSPVRRAYRAEWDARLSAYLRQLRRVKPVILCGDLNATVDERDAHHDSLFSLGVDAEFIAAERENLRNLLDSGFLDCFRDKHPEDCHAYTWWSYKHHDRNSNRGWRLDYFLVSGALRDHVVKCEHMTRIYGSDHCPVELELNLDFSEIAAQPNPQSHPSNAPRIRRINVDITEQKRAELTDQWNIVDWDGASRNLARLQADLATAAVAHNIEEINLCQRRIFKSMSARLLAVRHVCSSSSGPGVDGEIWAMPYEKMLAALSLDPSEYRSMCNRLVLIRTRDGKERKIHVPSYYDRAMETLSAMALDPVAEAWADHKSFAFRRGRTVIDMAHYVRLMFTHHPLFRSDGSAVYDSDPPEWAVIADVHQCYGDISHKWLLLNIPLDQHLLYEFLRAGYLFHGELFSNAEGVGIGRALSPILANMTLDGLQKYLIRRMFPGSLEPDYAGCNLVRYCDDIIVAARSRNDAETIRGYIAEFLQPRGLELSCTKTRIVNINMGFDFVGRHYVKKDDVVHMTPSEDAIKKFEASLEETVFNHTGSQASLIAKLNRKLDGWATFHKSEESAEAFHSVDVHLTATLLRRCRSMRPRWDIDKIRDFYWYRRADGQWIFTLRDDRTKCVRKLVWRTHAIQSLLKK